MSDESGGENPLVPQSKDNAAVSNFGSVSQGFEGSGIFSDAASTISDAASGDWGAVAADAAGDGLDALGVAMDPLGSLAGAGIGWLIEHISFLKKPLDLLAGDPDAVTRKAQTWTNIANQLNKSASDYQNSAKALSEQHKGAAADAYQQSAGNYCTTISQAATHAQSAAQAMNVAGTIVGTTRGLIRDSVSQFAGDAIVKFAASSALAPVTLGASEAAFIADEVAEGTSLGAKIAGKMSKVAETLDKLAKGGSKSAEALAKTGEKVAKDAGKSAEDGAKTAARSATKMDKYKAKVDDLNTKIAHHNDAVADKKLQIGKLEDKIANEADPAKQAKLQHYLDETIRPGAAKLDEKGAALAKERGELAETRADAWKSGLQERTFGKIPGFGEGGHLDQAHQFLEQHKVFDKTLDGAADGYRNAGSEQPNREQEAQDDSKEDIERYERENPNFRGSLLEG